MSGAYTETISVSARQIRRTLCPGDGSEWTLEFTDDSAEHVGAGWASASKVAVGSWVVQGQSTVEVLSDAAFKARFQPAVSTLLGQSRPDLGPQLDALTRRVKDLETTIAALKAVFMPRDPVPATQSLKLPGIESLARVGQVGAPPPGVLGKG